ncbi:MAG: SpoIIE family protein phosphatase [Rhodocyclaceae bacterium]
MVTASPSFRVLVADDNPGNRALLRAYLARLGFSALMAENGRQAIELFESEAPDIVLMDVMMPGIDGLSAIARIRALPQARWTPIVIVSAMGAETDVVQGLGAGADDYLTKPLSYKVFAAKMRTLSRMLGFQRAQEEASRRERVVSDAVGDGIITFNAEGRILDCNNAACGLFAVSREGIVDASILAFIREQERACFMGRFRACLEGTGHADFIGNIREMTALACDGRLFPMELRVSELDVEEGRLFIAVVRDISDRREIEQQLADNAQRLQRYHDEAENEADLAKDLIERLLRHKRQPVAGVDLYVLPAQRFSGDIVMAARSQTGRLYTMLADATGHGLAAAMSGLSVVNHFYQSVDADLPVPEAIMGMNATLQALLPSDRFVSAAMVGLDEGARKGEIWIGGVPDVWLVTQTGRIIRRIASSHLPLGITSFGDTDCAPVRFAWEEPGYLLLCSDGVLEAIGSEGGMFGEEGLERALRRAGSDRLAALKLTLAEHLGGRPAHDDVSMLLISLP